MSFNIGFTPPRKGQKLAEVRLLPTSNRTGLEDLLALNHKSHIIACDFYIEGAEEWMSWLGHSGIRGEPRGRVTTIDHHAPVPDFARPVTSTTFALAWRRGTGRPAQPETLVVINHTDCDSILSSAIVSGELDPVDRFAFAAMAADHTGEENEIADLLQALEEHHDRSMSLRNLYRLLEGNPVEPAAASAMSSRWRSRDAARKLVASRMFLDDRIAWAEIDEPVNSVLIPGALRERKVPAWIVLLAKNESGRWFYSLRLGLDAPQGFTLNHLRIGTFDSAYGGRWNAGSNYRGGGTHMPPEQYLAAIRSGLPRP